LVTVILGFIGSPHDLKSQNPNAGGTISSDLDYYGNGLGYFKEVTKRT